MERERTAGGGFDELIRDLDPDIIAASREVDRTLIHWLRALPPLERVAWTMRTAARLAALRTGDG
ncbi:MAG TPA: hypothetical protein VM285_15370 [Polyangia bacterium]|nr:hypothetical protein [Polyangia bacterium]